MEIIKNKYPHEKADEKIRLKRMRSPFDGHILMPQAGAQKVRFRRQRLPARRTEAKRLYKNISKIDEN